jgi:hypothetical protein
MLHTNHRNHAFVVELIRCDTKFLVVGGLAVQFYCPDRDVDDLDLLVEATPHNAEQVVTVATEFGYQIDPESLLAHPAVQLPMKNELYLDILTPKPSGEAFDSLWASSVRAHLNDLNTPIRLPSLKSLVRMKQEACLGAQPEDLQKHEQDLRLLEARPIKTPFSP